MEECIVYTDNLKHDLQDVTTNIEVELTTNHRLVTAIWKMVQVDTKGEIKYGKVNIGKLRNQEKIPRRDKQKLSEIRKEVKKIGPQRRDGKNQSNGSKSKRL